MLLPQSTIPFAIEKMGIDEVSTMFRSMLSHVEARFGHKAVSDLIRDVVAENLRHHPDDFHGIVECVFEICRARDAYTAQHQKRVSHIARGIGERLALPAHDIIGITLAAAVHDLGKIRVPHEILSKPSAITAAERMLLQEHAALGHDLMAPIKFPWPVAKVALQHHEKIDGTGYPNNLKGDDILLESRIVAVADAVEAIGSHRPYRPSLGIDFALEEAARLSGSAFDPIVVKACTAWCNDNRDFLT